ncbi:unnamed protein product [Pieris brassicae]|uniref:Uncharacterized protein n=1 Tax=Pieris brassicae TaxID=7116 RepID=A0A9P0X1C7_PIEBR|nr:unnamed protein product [Pieris brassicae]
MNYEYNVFNKPSLTWVTSSRSQQDHLAFPLILSITPVSKSIHAVVSRIACSHLLVSYQTLENCRNFAMSATKSGLPRLESLERVSHIPIVESGIGVTEKIYSRIRESNALIRWYFTLGEKSLGIGVQLALPAVQLLETPIHQLDRFLCKSLDVVEKQIPSIYLPPQAWTRE